MKTKPLTFADVLVAAATNSGDPVNRCPAVDSKPEFFFDDKSKTFPELVSGTIKVKAVFGKKSISFDVPILVAAVNNGTDRHMIKTFGAN